jgi:hypothetical protein
LPSSNRSLISPHNKFSSNPKIVATFLPERTFRQFDMQKYSHVAFRQPLTQPRRAEYHGEKCWHMRIHKIAVSLFLGKQPKGIVVECPAIPQYNKPPDNYLHKKLG